MCLSLACFCCLSALRARSIELIALISNIIIIGFFIWSLIGIPWDFVKSIGKILFFVSFAISVIAILILIIVIIKRCNGAINNEKNGCGIRFVIILIIIDILGFIVLIIAEIIIIVDLRKDDDDFLKWKHGEIKSGEWASAAASPSLIEIFWIIHWYCVSCLLTLIKLKTNFSYREYIKQNGEPKSAFDTVNMNKPNLAINEYDKNAYSGNPGDNTSGNNISMVKVMNGNQDLNTNYAIA